MNVLDPATPPRRQAGGRPRATSSTASSPARRSSASSAGVLAGLRPGPLRGLRSVLVQWLARERLQALGQAEGTIAKDVPEVLFVCVQNAAAADGRRG